MNAAIVLLENEFQSMDAEIVEIRKLKEEIELKEKVTLDRKEYLGGLIERTKEADAKQAEEDKKALAIEKRRQTLEEKKKDTAKPKPTPAKVITKADVETAQELPKP